MRIATTLYQNLTGPGHRSKRVCVCASAYMSVRDKFVSHVMSFSPPCAVRRIDACDSTMCARKACRCMLPFPRSTCLSWPMGRVTSAARGVPKHSIGLRFVIRKNAASRPYRVVSQDKKIIRHPMNSNHHSHQKRLMRQHFRLQFLLP